MHERKEPIHMPLDLEAMPSSNRRQHISCSTERCEDAVSVTSTYNSQPTNQLEEDTPPTNPTEIALLWSLVFEEAGSAEAQSFPAESSALDYETIGKIGPVQSSEKQS